jgi:replication factor A1
MAAELADQFESADAEIDIEIDEAEIQGNLETLINDYSVQPEEAKRSVRSSLLDDAGLERDALLNEPTNDTVLVDTIDTADQWVDLEVQVVDLWDDTHESMAQAGLLGDESGTIKFIAWEKSDLPALQEGESYRLQGVSTDEYEGRYSVNLVSTTAIERLEDDVEAGDDERTLAGALVDIKSGSGLIKRCTADEDCTRVIQNGRCAEHGECDGEFDLRIKGVLDDGQEAQDILLDAEATEDLTGVGLDEATDMAMDALDTAVVGQRFEDELIGRYYEVRGPQYGQYLLVETIEQTTERDEQQAEELLIEARSEVVDVADAADELDGETSVDKEAGGGSAASAEAAA